jgi:membrane dipeptidase
MGRRVEPRAREVTPLGWLIVDGHEDIATEVLETGRDFGVPAPPGHALSLPDLQRGGVGVVLATIFAPEGYWKGEGATEAAERQMTLYDQLLEKYDEHLFRLESRGDLSLCKAGGPIGVAHLMEGADPIRHPQELVRWVERGVRFVGLAWNTPNRYAGGTRDDAGLTDPGRRLLEEMARLGVVPDLSHLNVKAFDDVLAHHPGLVVASHSNAAALRAHRRNLSDAQIKAIAQRDGLVGIVLYGPFLAEHDPTMDSVFRHVDHMVSLVGPDHVGLGSDLDGGFRTDKAPKGLTTVADLSLVGEVLAQRGYADDAIARILGGNWMRILRRVLPE